MKSKIIGGFFIACAVMSCAWVYSVFSLVHIPILGMTEKEQELRAAYGALGDYFGGLLNPIFGFFGICLLLLTLYYTREDLSKTNQALDHQKKEARVSRYTNTVFQLSSSINRQIGAVNVLYSREGCGPTELSGYETFEFMGRVHTIARERDGEIPVYYQDFIVKFFRSAELWILIDFIASSLEYFDTMLTDTKLEPEEKHGLLSVVEININFEFMSFHCTAMLYLIKFLSTSDTHHVAIYRRDRIASICDKIEYLNDMKLACIKR